MGRRWVAQKDKEKEGERHTVRFKVCGRNAGEGREKVTGLDQ